MSRLSILMGSKNPMRNTDSAQNQQNINNNQKNKNIQKNNINKISNRLFILSPTVKEEKDIECTRNDFSQETTDYIILGYIGRALKTMHKKTNRLYSIKAIRKDKIIKNGLTNNLNKCIEIMYKVDHCFFLRLLNHFEDDINLYLIFQCINEVTLLDKINLKKLTKEQIYKYFKQVLEALQFLHSKKIFFISLEPESIIIDNDDNVRLTDYAYSKITGFETNNRGGFKTDSNMFVNSYVAPELISYNKGKLHKHRSKGSEKSDLWQLGMLAYEMITGDMLFGKTESVDQFYKLMSTPVKKNNEIIKRISEIPEDYNMFTNLIIQLLDFNPKERIGIENILNIKEIQKVSYEKKQIEYSERIINLKNANEGRSPQEQLINKLNNENKKLKTEIIELKGKISELTKRNEDLNQQINNYQKIINEEPNIDNITKEVEYRRQIRNLEINNQFNLDSLNEAKALNENLNKKIKELENVINQNNFKSTETIRELEKKIEELENKLCKRMNKGYSNESLQYYISLFNDNIDQFTSLINIQNKISKDLNENNTNKIENIINEKSNEFKNMVNEIMTKISDYIKNNKELVEKNKNEKINWLNKRIDELMSFKRQCLTLCEQNNKLQNENDILKERYENITKLSKEKEELNKLKFTKIKDKVRDVFDNFIVQNCPTKYEEFKLICKNFSFESLDNVNYDNVN